MLFEIAMLVMLLFVPICMWKAFEKGYNLRAFEEGRAEIPEKGIKAAMEKKRQAKRASQEAEKKRERTNQILKNIEVYDGTANGQKEIV